MKLQKMLHKVHEKSQVNQ